MGMRKMVRSGRCISEQARHHLSAGDHPCAGFPAADRPHQLPITRRARGPWRGARRASSAAVARSYPVRISSGQRLRSMKRS